MRAPRARTEPIGQITLEIARRLDVRAPRARREPIGQITLEIARRLGNDDKHRLGPDVIALLTFIKYSQGRT
ncbi:hypothetical protein J6590_007495 [Homalodisca vitripennis]|nr:hypothetical protein J6590_007495 [Homalodisca vitripennis]